MTPTDVPRSRDEALAVLGMGPAAQSSTAALKKIVDGLRQSWHPDLATDEAERRSRELRIMQINAAWDIIANAQDTDAKTQAMMADRSAAP